MKYKCNQEADLIKESSSLNSKRQRELQESSTVQNKNAIVKKVNDKASKKQQEFMCKHGSFWDIRNRYLFGCKNKVVKS